MINDETETGAADLPSMQIHETDNYITAIIGGKKGAEGKDVKKDFSDFLDMLKAIPQDPALREQLLDMLKGSPLSAEFLLEALESPLYAGFYTQLLALCWEASIDMTAHLPYFTKLAARSNDPLMLLELQTIIQDMDLSDATKRNTALEVLTAALPSKTDPVAKEITRDIVDFLESRE
jgi:hypothetical protein